MFGFLKKKSMKKIRQLTTSEGHKAVITKETLKHLINPVRYHISIYSKTEPNCIVYGQVVHSSLDDAVKVVQNWREILIIVPQPIGLLKT